MDLNLKLVKNYSIAGIVLYCLILSGCKSPKKPSGTEIQSTDKGVVLVHSESSKKIDVYIDGEIFTSYIYPEDLEKPVLYPVRTAKGTIITRGFPLEPREGERVDHPHQLGVWFNYGDVNGYDFWNNSSAIPEEQKADYGKVVHREVVEAISRDELGILKVAMDWVVQPGDEETKETLLVEDTRYEFHGDENARVIDRITKLTAKDNEVNFSDNKEGLFAMRMDRAFEYPSDEPLMFTDAEGNPATEEVLNNEGVNGHYRNSEGIEDLEVWGKRARWVGLSATKGDEEITIAIIDHPENPGYPAYWHARGYGLFALNNLGQKIFSEGKEELNFKLNAGESVSFKHRLYITSGHKATDEELNKQFEEFSQK